MRRVDNLLNTFYVICFDQGVCVRKTKKLERSIVHGWRW